MNGVQIFVISAFLGFLTLVYWLCCSGGLDEKGNATVGGANDDGEGLGGDTSKLSKKQRKELKQKEKIDQIKAEVEERKQIIAQLEEAEKRRAAAAAAAEAAEAQLLAAAATSSSASLVNDVVKDEEYEEEFAQAFEGVNDDKQKRGAKQSHTSDFRCDACRKSFSNAATHEQHLKSSKHIKNTKKQ